MSIFLQGAFWLSLSLIFYTFLGYPIVIYALSRYFPRPIKKEGFLPSVTLLIPAYNEADIIIQKIENSLQVDYPAHLLNIVIVADGSDDETLELVGQYAEQGILLYHQAERQGKILAINRVMPYLHSDIVVFSDANAMLEAKAIKLLVSNFADESVGAVAGEKRVRGGGESFYWRYESFLKQCDSQFNSVMGAAGELFAIRRELFQPLEADTLLDDFMISMRLVAQGWRVVYERQAVVEEDGLNSAVGDWQRRTRNAAGGFRCMSRLWPLLNPKFGWVWWQYLSHRVLRWAVTPFLLPLVFVLNFRLRAYGLYKWLLWGQLAFYGGALWGYWQNKQGRRNKVFYALFYFCLMNVAAIAGFWRYITNSQPVTWVKTR